MSTLVVLEFSEEENRIIGRYTSFTKARTHINGYAPSNDHTISDMMDFFGAPAIVSIGNTQINDIIRAEEIKDLEKIINEAQTRLNILNNKETV
jgi:hypothetical protein